MEKLQKVKDMVRFELENRPETRNSDRLLIVKVYEDYFGVKNDPFVDVLMRDDLPNFESIRRNRAAIQRAESSLRASDTIADYRMDKEQIYFSFFEEDVQ